MNKYRIKMNDKVYEMEIELISGDTKSVAKAAPVAPKAAPAAPKAAPVAAKPAAQSAPKAQVGGGVSSPMPGTILKINVAEGETVQAGQTVLVLEAMKMENEITAPKAGVVSQIAVQEGQTVANGEFLFSVE